MNIIIPMAGRGSRLRPHTISVPKPMVKIGGKPIVQHLVEDITETLQEDIDEIGFITGRFGAETEEQLLEVARKCGAKGSIHYQDEPLGTAHAILCAKDLLDGNVVVAFADTLFDAHFSIDKETDGVIYVHRVDDPSSFGVVKTDANNHITEFIEKPDTFISDLAIIGIYYFKDGNRLRQELQYLIDNNVKEKGEFSITTALENMKSKGNKFAVGEVREWLDCGNKYNVIETHQRILDLKKDNYTNDRVDSHSIIIDPCYIGENVEIKNSIVGPFVSIEANAKIENSVVKNSIIEHSSEVNNAVLENAMLGNNVVLSPSPIDLSIGDFSSIK